MCLCIVCRLARCVSMFAGGCLCPWQPLVKCKPPYFLPIIPICWDGGCSLIKGLPPSDDCCLLITVTVALPSILRPRNLPHKRS